MLTDWVIIGVYLSLPILMGPFSAESLETRVTISGRTARHLVVALKTLTENNQLKEALTEKAEAVQLGA
jgi:hypothetical protein